MDGADEDVSEPHPEQSREPAPAHGHGRADDGSRAGDGRKVMPEEDVFVGGNIVDTVVEALGRGINGIRCPDDVTLDLLTVDPVESHVNYESDDNNNSGSHLDLLLSKIWEHVI